MKKKLTILILYLFIFSSFCPSIFQKGGVNDCIYILTFINSILISLTLSYEMKKLFYVEKIFISLIIGCFVASVTSLIVFPAIIDFIFDDKTWFLWKTTNRILINYFYYLMNFIIIGVLNAFYYSFRIQNGKYVKTSS
ncbi:hypothetical protein [Flavobacterium sp. N2270]|uniref:hypothetical protein n=1 Tax=Flavobacterium sp. N2270 TaxID=2986831 RepID=UPI00222578C7|nr:hypothetical protein [Flavobacterium sp. N2270]